MHVTITVYKLNHFEKIQIYIYLHLYHYSTLTHQRLLKFLLNENNQDHYNVVLSTGPPMFSTLQRCLPITLDCQKCLSILVVHLLSPTFPKRRKGIVSVSLSHMLRQECGEPFSDLLVSHGHSTLPHLVRLKHSSSTHSILTQHS